MTFDANIESKMDFAVLREDLLRRCGSALGRERVEAMACTDDYHEILRRLQITEEMRLLLQDATLSLPRGEADDMREALARVRIEGLFLDETELMALRRTIDYAAHTALFLRALDEKTYPHLRLLPPDEEGGLAEVVQRINRVLDPFGRVADSASPEMARIRRELAAAQGSVSRVLQRIMRAAQAAGVLDKEASPTLREGRLVLPVPPAYKRKLGGIVHDESATGKTVYVEPQEVVEANNHIRELEGDERRERIRLLIELTNRLRPSVPLILSGADMLGEVDFLRAKAEQARQLRAALPAVVDYPMMDWRLARHPALYLRFTAQGKEVVPMSLRLRAEENHMLMISGPNAGGKSVCLKTVASVQYMLQCGLLVPMDASSTMGVFSSILMDIGDEQSMADDLSTYSSHLRNMKRFLREADDHSLLLMDELGSGTEPLMGGAIAEAVLAELVEKGAFAVITTHYTNLKHFAERTPGVVNAAMLYDRQQLRPLFLLSIGQAGSSFALEMARQTGLPESTIARVKELVGSSHFDYEKQLQDIARDKKYWADKRQAIHQREKALEEKVAYYEEQISGIRLKKREMLDEARQQAADLLQQSNRTIERTIREIKEAKADKERTKRARQKVENLKAQVAAPEAKRPAETPKAEKKQKQVMRDLRDLRMLTKDPARYLAESAPGKAPVRSTVIDEMRRRKQSFSLTLDLRGLRVDEGLETFMAYLDDAVMVSAGEVTILHGTGTGALKQAVRDYLNERNKARRKRGERPFAYRDGDPDRGGAGLTIIEV